MLQGSAPSQDAAFQSAAPLLPRMGTPPPPLPLTSPMMLHGLVIDDMRGRAGIARGAGDC
jgi:hypothetical protein